MVVSSVFRVCYNSHKGTACLYQKGWAFMPTQEERLTAVEQGLAAVQGDFLIHLSENNRQMAALNKVISTQELHSRDIDHNVTILLGIAGSQGKGIKAIKDDLGVIKESVEHVGQQLGGFEHRFTFLEEKLEQVLRQLATLTTKLE